MIQIDSVDFTYPAAEFRLRVPAFQVAPGEKVAVIGASGSGKTTRSKGTDLFGVLFHLLVA